MSTKLGSVVIEFNDGHKSVTRIDVPNENYQAAKADWEAGRPTITVIDVLGNERTYNSNKIHSIGWISQEA